MNVLRWLRRLEDAALVLTLTAMVLLAVTQIVLRNVFETGLGFADPALRVLVLWTALLGALVATRDDRHVRIDLLTRFLPERARGISLRLAQAATAVLAAGMAWHAGRFVVDEHDYGTIAFSIDIANLAPLDVPAWMCQLIIPFVFAMIAVRYVRHVIVGPPAS